MIEEKEETASGPGFCSWLLVSLLFFAWSVERRAWRPGGTGGTGEKGGTKVIEEKEETANGPGFCSWLLCLCSFLRGASGVGVT